MPECSVCGPFSEPAVEHVESEQHQTLAAMSRDVDGPIPERVPDWVTPVLGPGSPCLICGVPGADQRHRVLDTIAERYRAGDSIDGLVYDYELPAEFVDRVVAEWPAPEVDEE
jgi:hypothetical protein